MKRTSSMFVSLVMLVSLLPTQVFAFSNAIKSSNIVQLPGQQTATVNYGNWLEGANSTLDISVSDVAAPSDIPDGTYVGWCVEEYVSGELHGQEATLYGTIGVDLPSDIAGYPWHKINYVLNHKIRGEGRSDLDYFKDVQTAIWLLIGEENPEFGVSPEALQMVEEANAHPGYKPEGGEVIAVVVYFDGIDQTDFESVQETIIEVELDVYKALSLIKTADPLAYDEVDQVITYNYVIENTGNVTLPAPFSVLDDKTEVSCDQPTDDALSPGETLSCSAIYLITLDDMDAGSVTNIASASGGGITSQDVTATVAATLPNPSLSLTKESLLDITVVEPDDQTNIGDEINYILTATNDGNVSLTDVTIDDPLLGVLSCTPTQPATLAPREAVVCTGSYTISQNDIDSGVVENTATASSDQTPIISTPNSAPILQPFPHIGLVKSTTTTSYDRVGQILDYSLVATNDGNAILTDVSISDTLIETLNCTQPVSLAPGESLSCTGSYSITQADLDAGTVVNTASVTSTDPDNQLVTAETSRTVNAASICQPTVITADFSQVVVGESVEGVGAVVSNLNIDAVGTAVKLLEATLPYTFGSPVGPTGNTSLAADGGFGDVTTQLAQQAPYYTFTFAGISVSNFSLHMLDFGDYNPTLSPTHLVSMTAYDGSGVVVDRQELTYNSPAMPGPTSSDLYGNLQLAGDAVYASPGQPGNWTWNVSGSGIVQVVLEFGAGYDPNIGFDTLTYTTECPICQTTTGVTANFSQVVVGESVEGVGAVVSNLNIDAVGTAVKLLEATLPYTFGSPVGPTGNTSLAADGGFGDVTTQLAQQAPYYTFTFAGISVSNFSLHMLDFGDYNPTLSPTHLVSMTAYDGSGVVVDRQELTYNSPAMPGPTSSDLYGNLQLAGDAVYASPGQPGNWTWNVSGSGIVQVVLEFGAGYDPNIGFDTLSFATVCLQ